MASEGATESQAVPDNLSFEEAVSLLEQTVHCDVRAWHEAGPYLQRNAEFG